MVTKCSFAEIALQFDPLVKKWLVNYRLLRDYDEMYQIALIALWEACQHFDSRKGAFPAFAELVVRGKLLTEIKRKKRYGDQHIFFETLPEIAVVQAAHDLDMRSLQSVTWLSNREKLWIEEAIIKDKKTVIIAAEQGVTMDTVRSWKKSTLAKLKQRLEKQA